MNSITINTSFVLSDIKKVGYLLIVFLSLGNVILRPSEDSKISLFRLLVPVMILLLLHSKKRVSNFLILVGVLLPYSFLTSKLSTYQNFNTTAFINFFLLIPYWWLCLDLKHWKYSDNMFLYRFIRSIIYFTLGLAFIQYFFGGVYPNTQNRLPEVNIYFWNGNELCMALGAFVPIYFFFEKGWIKKIVIISMILFLSWHNNARAIFFSVFIFLFLYYNIFLLARHKLLYTMIFLLLSVYGLWIISEVQVFGVSLLDFLFYPIGHLLTLDPMYPNIGSIHMRTNAIIFGIQELVQSNFLGIGPDNSREMMISHHVKDWEEWSAVSMHNLIFQMITEWGVIGFLFISYFSRSIFIRFGKFNWLKFLILVAIYSSLVLTSSISSAPFVNYLYLLVFYSTIIYTSEILLESKKKFNPELKL